jgi:hypothetical protein
MTTTDRHTNTGEGKTMSQSQRSAGRPSRAIGFLAALGVFPRVQGSGAPGVRASRQALFVVVTALGVFALGAASAFAAPLPEKPVTGYAGQEEVSLSTEAGLFGVLDPGKEGAAGTFELGTYEFVYRKSATECQGAGEKKAPASPAPSLGEGYERVTEHLTNLTPNTKYTYCIVARNSAGEPSVGNTVTFRTALPPEEPEIKKPTAILSNEATLNGVLDPKSKGEAGDYYFVYSQSSECEGAGEQSTPETAYAGAVGELASAQATGLIPNKTYTFCLRARNVQYEHALSPPETFTTPAAPPTIVESTTGVSDSAATLHASINPDGAATTYFFEYGPSTEYDASKSYGTKAPLVPASIGEGNDPVSVEAPVQGLLAGETYHYRVIATNAKSGAEGTPGPDQTFTTQPAGGEFKLPDNRSYELVSPPNRDGALLEAITHEGGVIESAEDGSAFTYVAATPPLPAAEGNPAYAYSQIMATRASSGGWNNRDIATPRSATNGLHAGHIAEYYFFNPELTSSILSPGDETELAPGETKSATGETESTIFIRNGLLTEGTNEYVPLVNSHNTPAGTRYGRIPRVPTGAAQLGYAGASQNLEHVIIQSKQPLTTGPAGFPGSGLYEWTKSTGELQPVSVLPGPGGEWAKTPELGAKTRQVSGAVSNSGNLVIWEDNRSLYVRDLENETTTLINPENGEESEARFQYATPDGSKVYFTDGQRLTPNSTAGQESPELYEYNTGTGTTTDLTPNPQGPGHESANVQGELLGVGGGGEYVYFVADGKLAAGATVGEPNVYIEDDGTVNFVTTLSTEDEFDWRGTTSSIPNTAWRTARVAPNGGYLAFMSDRSLTGYDNDDAVSGLPDEEVYLYDADSGHLVCASCDPSGARPHGVLDQTRAGEGLGLLVDRPEMWSTDDPGVDHWLAGSIPGWTSYQENFAQYQSRYLTNEGRLFFDSADGLVPQDQNGKEDVYEYEPEGVGPKEAKCGPGSVSGSEAYKREGAPGDEAAGCVALISSGRSSQESAFLDASAKGPGGEEGEDVFFISSAQLTGQEVESGGDIYDAHICSSCASTAAVASPPCTNEESCRAAPAPQPAIFGSPASATFSGPGNITPAVTPTVTTKKKTAAELKAEKLTKALKQCEKDKQKAKRAKCQEQARSKYGPAKKKTKTKKATNDRRGK